MFQSSLSRNAWIFVIHCVLLYKDIMRQAHGEWNMSVCILLAERLHSLIPHYTFIKYSYNNMLLINERYKALKKCRDVVFYSILYHCIFHEESYLIKISTSVFSIKTTGNIYTISAFLLSFIFNLIFIKKKWNIQNVRSVKMSFRHLESGRYNSGLI